MSQQDAPGFGEGLENQAPLEEPDPAQTEQDDDGEPTEAEVLHDDPPADEAVEAVEADDEDDGEHEADDEDDGEHEADDGDDDDEAPTESPSGPPA